MQKTNYNLKDAKPTDGKVITIPEQIAIYTDQEKGFKSIALPFTFPSSVNGVLIITHLNTLAWVPQEEIESITIKFKK